MNINKDQGKVAHEHQNLQKRAPEDDSEIDDIDEEPKRVNRFPKDSIKVLRDWFLDNIKNPYPKYDRTNSVISLKRICPESLACRLARFKTGLRTLESDIQSL